MPTELGEPFFAALEYAARLHARQRRKASDVPYVAHLLAVAAIVLEHGGSQVEAIAALLHDAVEDQGGAAQLAEIERRFGPEVARIVAACTDTDQTPKPPWRARKEEHLAHASQADAAVRLVLAADKLHNGRAILADLRRHGDAVWSRFNGGREGTLWYYRAMYSALAASGTEHQPLLDELGRVVAELGDAAH
ncbi:MAG: HD domain-containing protein [Pirellulales bacterium]|nr:HD domain-containing protein [Pirellulales bacterium]